MRIDILTLFPGMFQGPFQESIIQRALERGTVQLYIHQFRDYAQDKHRTVDDYPYGGGPGMVMKPEPVFRAVEGVLAQGTATVGQEATVILLTPQGRLFNQRLASQLALKPWLVLLCGHYEGVDERIRQHLATDEISIGDYVLTGGELPAMVVVDAVVRRLPGVLGGEGATIEDSHESGLLEYPQYTRPAEFRGWRVPGVLLSGNHREIARWRRKQSILRTWLRRSDLLEKAELTAAERSFLEAHRVLNPEDLREREH